MYDILVPTNFRQWRFDLLCGVKYLVRVNIVSFVGLYMYTKCTSRHNIFAMNIFAMLTVTP